MIQDQSWCNPSLTLKHQLHLSSWSLYSHTPLSSASHTLLLLLASSCNTTTLLNTMLHSFSKSTNSQWSFFCPSLCSIISTRLAKKTDDILVSTWRVLHSCKVYHSAEFFFCVWPESCCKTKDTYQFKKDSPNLTLQGFFWRIWIIRHA